ncbi:MAG: MYG1 family protein [Verrucomicrobiota bacterium]
MPIHRIVTHPGGAHKDDFLACALLVHRHGVPIHRRDPSEPELDDPTVCVVDVGGRHEPEKKNFDHHQFPRDHPPVCALSLVLQDLGIYEDAKAFCEWLEVAEWFDCRGPQETARYLGVEREVLNQLNSPADVTLLIRFARAEELNPGDPLWEVMRMIGHDMITYVSSLRERLDFIGRHAEWWAVDSPNGPVEALFLPRTDPMPAESSQGLERFVVQTGREDSTQALLYPDRRGNGYALSRFNDSQQMDFTQIDSCEDVHFAHVRGFVAKSSATEPARLKELLSQARV